MADKKYYWLKLNQNFFKRHDIKIIKAMPNGKDYVIFYLTLLLESLNHDGELRFSDTIPYNEEMLSIITDTNIDIVRSAMKILTELKMVEVFEDSTIFMTEINKMIGCESSVAERVRNHRSNQKVLHCNTDVTDGNNLKQKCNTEIEIEKEIELDIDIDKDNTEGKPPIDHYSEIQNLYNSICVSFPKAKVLSKARKKAIKAGLKTYGIDIFKTVFEKAESSNFLKGKNDKNWSANFDWLINDTNIAKVLNGNYANKDKLESSSKTSGNYEIIPDKEGKIF